MSLKFHSIFSLYFRFTFSFYFLYPLSYSNFPLHFLILFFSTLSSLFSLSIFLTLLSLSHTFLSSLSQLYHATFSLHSLYFLTLIFISIFFSTLFLNFRTLLSPLISHSTFSIYFFTDFFTLLS